MNLRSGPGTSYEKSGSLPGSTFVYLYEISGNWYRIKYDGSFHWASGDYLNVTLYKNIENNPNIGDVIALGLTTTSLNIRSGPGTSYESLGTVITGSLVEIYQENAAGYWHLINFDGTAAYISGRYVETIKKPVIMANAKTNASASMYRGEGTDFQLIGTIKKDSDVAIIDLDASSGWYLALYNGRYGYVSASALSIESYTDNVTIHLNRSAATITVKDSIQLIANCKDGDSVTWTTSKSSVATVSSSGKVTAKAAGTAVITAKTSSGYTDICTITVNSGTLRPYDSITVKGNVYDLYETLGEAEEAAIEAYIQTLNENDLRDRLVLTALRFAGYPYGSADCSQVSRYVYATENVSLPRVSDDQAEALASYEIDISKIRPGNLVFFKNYEDAKCSCGSKCSRYRSIHHVAVYIGEIDGKGYFLEASSVVGKSVIRQWDGTNDHSEMLIEMAISRF